MKTAHELFDDGSPKQGQITLSKDSSMWDLSSGQGVSGPNPDGLSQMVRIRKHTICNFTWVRHLVVGSLFLAFVMPGGLGATCCRRRLHLEQDVAPEGTGDRDGDGVHVLETVPMTASTSSSSAWSWARPPNTACPELGRVSPHAPFPQCPGMTVALSHVGYQPSVSPWLPSRQYLHQRPSEVHDLILHPTD
ncbi:hypothetical protein Z043_125748 [Scleropages formosus]|uniref:Uncharacterized protein n=1 Tax=Scleropages formosus TaxID=113540 RepID=A0A0P7TGN6_SCLFO|nr:hypothetical protein Z043_125748 [Scleropages formosus]